LLGHATYRKLCSDAPAPENKPSELRHDSRRSIAAMIGVRGSDPGEKIFAGRHMRASKVMLRMLLFFDGLYDVGYKGSEPRC